MAHIEFFFDLSSPYSYIASTQLEAVAARAGATFEAKPFVLAAVFKATGNSAPAGVTAKAFYIANDVAAWARDYGVPFGINSQFPFNGIKAERFILAAGADGWKLTQRYFHAFWGEDRDPTDPAVLQAVANAAGLDGAALAARTEQADIKDSLRALTDDAIARGAFGAPTFFVGDQMFVGNDRLPFVERAARGEKIYR